MRQPTSTSSRAISAAAIAFILATVMPAGAQVTPAAGYTPPDDTPSIRVGATIYLDYTWQTQPKVTDADGNLVSLNAFNVGRAYVNVTGNINHIIAFRITPDIVREAGTTTNSTFGSYVYRLKYAYGQFNLDDWMTRGSWARFGMQQTPYVDFIESVYRYRWQGPTFEDREGFLSSSDVGASFHYNFKNNYGDVHTGFYNGDNYNRPEVNNQKAWMTRGTVRPLPMHQYLRGLRLTGFYNLDAYIKDGERRRGIFLTTFEHPYAHAGFSYLWMTDQTRAANPKIDGNGYSVFVTPKTAKGYGFEGLLRFDHLDQEQSTTALEGKRSRTIAGIAYWFRRQGAVSSAVMLDFENVDNDNYLPVRADERRWIVHMMVIF